MPHSYTYDYRKSHLGQNKAFSYDKQFSTNAYRAMIWQHEQNIINSIIHEFCPIHTVHLDFACGTGRILNHLERFRSISSVGVDISPSMLDVARNNTKRAEILEGDITRIDILGNRKFDLITAFRFFPNAQDELRRDVMHILASHLERGGILVFNNHKNLLSTINQIKTVFRRGFGRGMTLLEVDALVKAAGLSLVQTYHVGVIPSTERYLLLPVKMLGFLEYGLSYIKILKNFAVNQIFVCRR